MNLEDISQMQMYVNYYVHDIKLADENKTIDILISTNKNETVVKYALLEDMKQYFHQSLDLLCFMKKGFITVIENEKKHCELKK